MRNRPHCVVIERQLHTVESQQLLVLLAQRVFRLGQNSHQRVLIQRVKRHCNRQTTDKFRNQTELRQILRAQLFQRIRAALRRLAGQLRAETEVLLARAALDNRHNAVERAAADKEDVCRVNLNHFLLGMLSATLRRNGGNRTFEDFQQRLLHALAADIARNRRIFALAGDFVDFVDVDDAALCRVNVVIRCLNQAKQDILHVFADVAGFRQARCISNRERHIQDARECLRQKRLAAARRSHHQDVRLLQFNIILAGALADALVMVVHLRGTAGGRTSAPAADARSASSALRRR